MVFGRIEMQRLKFRNGELVPDDVMMDVDQAAKAMRDEAR